MTSVACARLVPVTLRPCPAAAATAARMPLFPAGCPELRGSCPPAHSGQTANASESFHADHRGTVSGDQDTDHPFFTS